MHGHIFLQCLHSSKRKQASKFLGFRVSRGKSRDRGTDTMTEEKCARTDLFIKQGPAKSVSWYHSRSHPTKHTQMQKNLWGQVSFLMKIQQLVTVTGQEVTTMWLVSHCEYVTKSRCIYSYTERKNGSNAPYLAF